MACNDDRPKKTREIVKPRYTPDPVPDSVEDPVLRRWLQDQHQRLDDYWPKDLEARLAALERAYPFVGGVWPIIDYSSVNFYGEWSGLVTQIPRLTLFTTGGFNAYPGGTAIDDTVPADLNGFSPSLPSLLSYFYEGDSDNLILVAGATLAWTSTGTNPWTQVTATTIGLDPRFVIKGVWRGADNAYYVAGVPNGFTNGVAIFRSETLSASGSDWSEHYSSSTEISQDANSNTIVSDGNGNVVTVEYRFKAGVGYEFKAAYSTDDGATWSLTPAIFTNSSSTYRPVFAFYENGQWFLTGYRGTIYGTSGTDPSTGWGLRYSEANTIKRTQCIKYANGKFLAGQGNAGPYYQLSSSNGTTWNVDNSSWIAATFDSITYDETDGLWAWIGGGDYKLSNDDAASWYDHTGTWSGLHGASFWLTTAT